MNNMSRPLNHLMKIKIFDVRKIKPYTRNAKKHTKEQIEDLKKSLTNFGWKQPLVVDTNCELVVGHARLQAAKELGYTEVPCVVADDLDEGKIRAYRLADNRLNESDWEMDLVLDELANLEGEFADMTGFDLDTNKIEDIIEKEAKPKKAKEVTCPNCSTSIFV